MFGLVVVLVVGKETGKIPLPVDPAPTAATPAGAVLLLGGAVLVSTLAIPPLVVPKVKSLTLLGSGGAIGVVIFLERCSGNRDGVWVFLSCGWCVGVAVLFATVSSAVGRLPSACWVLSGCPLHVLSGGATPSSQGERGRAPLSGSICLLVVEPICWSGTGTFLLTASSLASPPGSLCLVRGWCGGGGDVCGRRRGEAVVP